jgi:hypothetical protein
MSTLFDVTTSREVLRRLEAFPPDAARQWGSMTPAQMMEHTARVLELAMGQRGDGRQLFIGKVIGRFFFRKFVGPEPFVKGAPTGTDYKIVEEPEFAATKRRLAGLIKQFQDRGPSLCEGQVHPFFGRMSADQWGVTQYKHVDHHLRQFGQ